MGIKDFSLTLDREDWGYILDGLVLERERSSTRKQVNSESNSDIRCTEIDDLIKKIYIKSQDLT